MTKIGERVGAIIEAVDKKDGKDVKIVRIAGYGVYEGDVMPDEENKVIFMGVDFAKEKRYNPKIKLDSGHVIWGCQCWWGPEERIKAEIKKYEKHGYTVEIVDPKEWEI